MASFRVIVSGNRPPRTEWLMSQLERNKQIVVDRGDPARPMGRRHRDHHGQQPGEARLATAAGAIT